MENKIWKAKSYLRLSKEDTGKNNSSRESNSIINQRDLICDFLNCRDDIELCGEWCDDGVSGVSFDRPAFNALMNDIRDGSINCVIVKDLSRFGRNHIDAGNYIENLFPLLGVRFIAINDDIDTLNPKTATDNILIPFKNLINDAYCRDISVKIRSQFEVKRKRGQFIGAFASYGYLKSKETKNKLMIDEKTADHVREIFRLKLNGMSADGIARCFNAMGISSPLEYKRLQGQNYVTNFKTNSKATWSATAILRILKNPLYIGTLVQGREGTPNHKIQKKRLKPKEEWVIAENCHEPIISVELFENVQRIMELDTRTAPENETVYLFSGILFCGRCGYNMTRKTIPSSNKKYIYYVCAGNKKKKDCVSRGIREDILADAILTTVKKRVEETQQMDTLLSYIDTVAYLKIRASNLNHQLNQKEIELAQCIRYKKGLYEAYIEGTVAKPDYDLFLADYSQQQEELEAEAATLRTEIHSVLEGRNKYSDWMENFKKHRGITELNRSIVVELIEKIIIYDKDTIAITFRHQSEYNTLLEALADASRKTVV